MDKIIKTEYTIRLSAADGAGRPADPASEICLAQVSDFHETQPEPVLARLREAQPDLILITGDLLEHREKGYPTADRPEGWTREEMDEWEGIRRHWLFSKIRKLMYRVFYDYYRDEETGRLKRPTHPERAYAFLREAVQIAPVIYSVGNHEWYFTDEDYRVFAECGVTLLDNADTVVEVGGRRLRVGGLSTRYDLDWLARYAGKDGTKILLMHHPQYYDRFVRDIDSFELILSGHVHGGQIRIAGRGLWVPGQGLFPKYHHGLYPTRAGRIIVSSGLKNTVKIPRIGNPCELVVIRCSL